MPVHAYTLKRTYMLAHTYTLYIIHRTCTVHIYIYVRLYTYVIMETFSLHFSFLFFSFLREREREKEMYPTLKLNDLLMKEILKCLFMGKIDEVYGNFEYFRLKIEQNNHIQMPRINDAQTTQYRKAII